MENTQTTVKNAAQDLEGAAHNMTEKVKSGVSTVGKQIGSLADTKSYKMIRERAEDAADVSVNFVKRYPLYTLLGATAIGVLAGFLLSRKND